MNILIFRPFGIQIMFSTTVRVLEVYLPYQDPRVLLRNHSDCSKEVPILFSRLFIFSVRLGFLGNNIGQPHTVLCKVIDKCGYVRVRLIPAPCGTGIVSTLDGQLLYSGNFVNSCRCICRSIRPRRSCSATCIEVNNFFYQ